MRNGLLAALLEVAPAAEGAVAETARQLREEAEVLDAVAAEALAGLGGGPVVELAALRALPARHGAAGAAGAGRDAAGHHARWAEIMTLGEAGGTRALDLGEGLRVVVEYGMLRFDRAGPPPEPEPVALHRARHRPLRRLGGARRRRAARSPWPSTAP